VSALLAALAPAGVFYPAFLGFVAIWLGAGALGRRHAGEQAWIAGTRAFESGVLAFLIFTIVGFSMAQVVLRSVFHTGIVWVEPLLRYAVLWIAFVAAVVVTGRLRHININVIGRLLPPRPRLAVARLTLAVAAAVCAALARGAWIYLAEEQSFGSVAFLGIPVWALTTIIFIGFALMAARFAAHAIAPRSALTAQMSEGGADGS